MHRLAPNLKLRIDRIDLMLASALAAVVVSYSLGYRLDWSQIETKPAEAEAAVPVAAIAPAPQAPATGLIVARKVGTGTSAAQTAWRPDAREEAWEVMAQELSRLASHHQGRVAIYLTDLKDGKSWSFHPDDLFPSASLIKVPIMVCVFYAIQDGRLALSEKLTLRRHNRVGGSGSLKWSPDGTRRSVRDLLQLMISESDNTATNLVIEALGLGYIQQQFPKMGLLYTGIYKEGMSLNGSRVAHENYTTAREMNMLMEKIYKGEMIDKPSSQLMLDILRHKKAVASRLAKGLPAGWEIAHKTGLLRHACHDSAVFLTPNGDYAMTVLTGQNGSYKIAKDFISRLGRVTFRHYGGYPYYYAKAYPRRRQFALR